jgi:RNA polymerase sigma-70 factor (ECF subfamily)
MGEGGELDDLAVRAFLEEEYPKVVAAVAMVSDSRPAAEDAVCEALARAWERSERGERIESLAAWVTAVAMNLSRSRWRRLLAERRARKRLGPSAGDHDGDRAVDVELALARLSHRQRQALVLHYYLGYEVREVAEILGIAEGTAKSTLHRGQGRSGPDTCGEGGRRCQTLTTVSAGS